MPQIERFAVAGGVNVITTDTLADAVLGALSRGENGHAYLMGDENLSFRDYLGLFWKAAGDPEPLPVEDRDHPLLPLRRSWRGAETTIYYEPDPAEVSLLGYRRHDVANAVQAIVEGEREIARQAGEIA